MTDVKALLDAASDGVLVTDARGSVVYANAAARRLLDLGAGASACAELCGGLRGADGKACSEACPLRDPARSELAITHVGRRDPGAVYEWRSHGVHRRERFQDLRVRCLRVRAPFLGLGEQESHFLLVEDASHELELRRHKEDWRSMIAHDLRSPLSNIHSALKLLEEAHPDPSESDAQLIAVSLRSCAKMMELLDLYLDVARLDAQAMPLKKRTVALAPLVERLAEEHRPAARARGIRIETRADADAAVVADEALLARVIANLIDNAVKYNVDNGAVTVFARGASVKVADTGRGIAAEDLPRVFDRYYQARMRREGRLKGNGLGLTFCREALKAMGGEIGVSSRPGEGSTFTARLTAPGGTS